MSKNTTVTRRQFLRQSSVIAVAAPITGLAFSKPMGRLSRQEARYYKKLSDQRVQCQLCPWQCIVEHGKRGMCDVRENRKGVYYSLVYGRVAAHHKDPIEKKPFFHFMPGSSSFSIATAGCNVDCKFCQNWELARRKPEDIPNVEFTPVEVVKYAKQWECQSIAFTYNEPTVFNEFVTDIASIGMREGLKHVVVSNGFINKKPLIDLCRVIDAYKVDLKAFTEDYYRNVVHGRLAPVLDTMVTLKSQGVWTEVVYLVVPTLNDNEDEIRKMVKWIYRELGPDVPVHFSRFYPKYKLRNLPPTPAETLERLRQIAMDGGLHYVYIGNLPGHEGENTYCVSCKKLLIGRLSYQIFQNNVKDGKCSFCGQSIPGIWK